MGSMRQKGVGVEFGPSVGLLGSCSYLSASLYVRWYPCSDIPVPRYGYDPSVAIAVGILVVSTLVLKNGAIHSSRCLPIDIICTTLYQPVLHCKVELRSVGLTRL